MWIALISTVCGALNYLWYAPLIDVNCIDLYCVGALNYLCYAPLIDVNCNDIYCVGTLNYLWYAPLIEVHTINNTVRHSALWKALLEMGVPTHFVKLISNLYDNQQACVRTEKGDSDWFNIGQGVRQGCILSPTLFNLYAEYIMRRVLENWNGGLSIGGYKLSNLRYADDTTLVATSALELKELLLLVKAKSEALGLRLNVSKTKIMIVGSDGNEDPIVVDGTEVEHVTQFNFLGSLITTSSGCATELRRGHSIIYGMHL